MSDRSKAPLLPDRHPQANLFVCDVADAVIKSDMASMEHPIFTLSKKPIHEVKTYEHGDILLEVTPSSKGIANIYDKDILIFAISQIMAARNEGRPYSREIAFQARDFLEFSNRHIGGHDYDLLKDSLDRLDGTRLRTTIKTGGEETWEAFGLIEGAKIKRKRHDGRVTEWGLKLSEWLFKAIEANEVLTLHPDYFRLRKPTERRIYEIARKHCGQKETWQIGLRKLKKKCGSSDALRNFRLAVRELCEYDHLPDYSVSMKDDMVCFRNRNFTPALPGRGYTVRLELDTFDAAREAAPGWDVYVIEQEWREWVVSLLEQGMEAPRHPDGAFIGFCRKWAERNGRP
ncbi:plasmid replication initiator RepA [Palleronia sediminis]|uniref:Plasmid replication initiator RepA n=1 Tax=Palleronia sediminis TaxID=2547833 RepID=A0A4R5ZZC7_9RHOB|nr:replication initiator protein A [Palleronia sediminis]TDL74888.1 plasmid replication initiator RepA [Palleronia sediminis]